MSSLHNVHEICSVLLRAKPSPTVFIHFKLVELADSLQLKPKLFVWIEKPILFISLLTTNLPDGIDVSTLADSSCRRYLRQKKVLISLATTVYKVYIYIYMSFYLKLMHGCVNVMHIHLYRTLVWGKVTWRRLYKHFFLDLAYTTGWAFGDHARVCVCMHNLSACVWVVTRNYPPSWARLKHPHGWCALLQSSCVMWSENP